MRNKLTALILALFVVYISNGQTLSDALPTGKPLQLPTEVTGLTVVDGTIYCSTKSLALRVKEDYGMLSSAIPNHVVSQDKSNICYAIRHPESGELYFVKKNIFGTSRLFRMVKEPNGANKYLSVKPGGRNISVEHPTFSDDGSYMVFSAKSGDSQGGRDLYLSVKNGHEWSMPINLDSINTIGEETTPTFWNGYLFFASNGRPDSYGGVDLYALKLKISYTKIDSLHNDIEVHYGHLQHLPYPFNSENDERAVLVKDDRTYVACEGDSTAIGDVLTSYDCTPDMIALSGVVRDKKGHLQPRSQVIVNTYDRRRAETITDGNGYYKLLLRKDKEYDITYAKVSFGIERYSMSTERKNEDDRLVEERTYNVSLVSFDPGQYIELQTLFGDDASIDLTEAGKEKLSSIIGFLIGNPGVEVQMTMYCGLERDKEYNQILAERRAQTIREYMSEQVPAAKNLTVTSGGNFNSKTSAKVNDLLTIKLGLF